MQRCVSGKLVYTREDLAIDALLELWVRNYYAKGSGPISVYRCDDCGMFHHTSKGERHERLVEFIESGELNRRRKAFEWEEKLKR